MNALPEPKLPEPNRHEQSPHRADGAETNSRGAASQGSIHPSRSSASQLSAELADSDLPTLRRDRSAPHPLFGPGRPTLPEELRQCQLIVEEAARQRGLSFSPIVYEMLTSEEVNAVAARDGFPIRYPHWRFGMEYEFLNKRYEHGSSKIYELVINSEPVYAYLMDSNNLSDQEFVICHVTGHADFFENNVYFS